MNSKTIILSSTGLKNIIIDNNDFTFSFGEREIRMNSIFAEFISPIVSHLHRCDPTINQLHYDMLPNTKIHQFYEIFTDDLITKLQLISSGGVIELSKSESRKMRQASILLCNEELFNKIEDLYPVDDTAAETVKLLEELEVCEIMKKMTNESRICMEGTISMIAKNFYLIDKSKIKTISKPLFHSIISNDHLKIESEDWLFDTIIEYFEIDEEKTCQQTDFSDIISFFEEMKMSYLSETKFKDLLQRVESEKMTEILWRNIRDRICQEEGSEELGSIQRYTKETVKPPSASARVFSFDGQECNRLNGIINFITKEAGGNVHDKGVISVTASSLFKNDDKFCAKNVVDFDKLDTRLVTSDIENSWLKYDFKDLRVRPTHYSIRSRDYGSGAHPMNWVIEGSNSNKDDDWTVIDRRSGVTSLKAKSVVCTFDIQQPGKENEFYRYLRIRQTEKNAQGDHHLVFSSLEYFGSIIRS